MSYTLAYTGAEIDALLGKIDAIFVAEYGSTIYSEVTAAIAAGNKVIVANAGKVYVYAGQDDNSGYVFTQSGPNAAKPNATYVTLSTGNVWSTATVDLATLQQFYASLMEDTASGSIASFPDGAENVPVKELTADIEPIQDLHGQASPYPEGGGANKLAPVSANATTTIDGIIVEASTDGSYYAHGTATANSYTYCALAKAYTIQAGDYLHVLNTVGYAWEAARLSLRNNNVLVADVAITNASTIYSLNSFAGQTFNQIMIGVLNGNSVDFKIYPMILNNVSATTPFIPYFNICPITGFTGAEITRTGKNLWDEEWESGYLSGASGTPQPNANRIRSKNFCAIVPSETYCLHNGGSVAWGLFIYDENKSYIGNYPMSANGNSVITLHEKARFFKVAATQDGVTTYNNDISINYPSTDTSYHAYNGTTYNIDWTDEAGTVYKGNLNATTGVLTITHGSKTFSGSDSWGAQGSSMFYTRTDEMAHLSNYSAMMCSLLKSFANNTATAFTTADYGITGYWDNGGTYPTYNWIYVKATGITSGADLNTFFAANPATVVYPLGAPITVQLTPTEVATLLGDNNIWSDTGDISVRYRCNTALYIEKKLGA